MTFSSIDFAHELAACGSSERFFNKNLAPVIRELSAAAADMDSIKVALSHVVWMSWIAQVKAMGLKDEAQDGAIEWMQAASLGFLLAQQGQSHPGAPGTQTQSFRGWSTKQKTILAQELATRGLSVDQLMAVLVPFTPDPHQALADIWNKTPTPHASSAPFFAQSGAVLPPYLSALYEQWRTDPATEALVSSLGKDACGVLNRYLYATPATDDKPHADLHRSKLRLVDDLLALSQSFETWIGHHHPAPATQKLRPFPKDLASFCPPAWSAITELREGLGVQLAFDFSRALQASALEDLDALLRGHPPEAAAQAAELALCAWLDLRDNMPLLAKRQWDLALGNWTSQRSVWATPSNVLNILRDNAQLPKLEDTAWSNAPVASVLGALRWVALQTDRTLLPGSLIAQLAQAPEITQRAAYVAVECLGQRNPEVAPTIQWGPGEKDNVTELARWMKRSTTVDWILAQVGEVPLDDQAHIFRINEALVDLAQDIGLPDSATAWRKAIAPAFAQWERENLQMVFQAGGDSLNQGDSPVQPLLRAPRRRL